MTNGECMTSPSQAKPPQQNRFAHLDGLRGWAALLVVVDHGVNGLDYALQTGRADHASGSWDAWLSGTPFVAIVSGGNVAVCIFFALSGFVLTHAYMRSRQSWLALASRRYVRLGIPMLAGCLLSWALLASGLIHPQHAAAITGSSWLAGQFHQQADLLSALLEPIRLLAGATLPPSLDYDSSLWTMPVEAIGSLVLISAFVSLRYMPGKLAGYAFCAAALISAGSYFSLFAFGAAVRLFVTAGDVGELVRRRWVLAILLVLGLFFATVPDGTNRWTIYNWMGGLAAHVPWPAALWSHSTTSFWHGIGAALILVLVSASRPMQAALSGPVGRFLGRISFPLYVLHLPVLMVVECDIIVLGHQLGLAPMITGVVSLIALVAVSLAVAAILTPAIEGGAINLSGWFGRATDARVKQFLQYCFRISGMVPAAAVKPQPGTAYIDRPPMPRLPGG